MLGREAEHGEGDNGGEGGERNMATVHGRIVQKGPNATDSFNETFLKAGGEEAVKAMTGLSNWTWKRKEWPTDWKKSVYVPRDHIANLRWMMEKAMEHQRDLYMCFIDYKKAFDCVDHEILWMILRDMGVQVHLIVLLRRLYTYQEATVRTELGETDNIDVGKGVRQGCILSPLLFNIYAEIIMREVLEEWERGISIGWRMVTNLRYADDTTLHAGTKEDLTELVGRVRRVSEKAGLYLKTKVMTTGDIGEVTVDGKVIEVVTKFVFLGMLITEDGLCEKEVRRRIAMGKAAMGVLTSIWKDRGVTLETKVKLVKVLVFPIVLYGAETWTMRKHERRKIDAFALWCWRRVLRVSWMERKTNITSSKTSHRNGHWSQG